MVVKILIVFAVGIIGALINAVILNKKIRPPKFRVDEYGTYLDLGIVKEFIASIGAAAIVALPIIAYVPITSLIISCSIPAIAGAGYIKTVIDKYITSEKKEMKEDLSKLERKDREKNKKAK